MQCGVGGFVGCGFLDQLGDGGIVRVGVCEILGCYFYCVEGCVLCRFVIVSGILLERIG